jgi:hypothetical protein
VVLAKVFGNRYFLGDDILSVHASSAIIIQL